MAKKKGVRGVIKLRSTESSHMYITFKNRRNNPQRLELKKYDPIYVYCRSGRRAQTTTTNLSFQGLNQIVCVSHSGMPDWEKAGYPVDT